MFEDFQQLVSHSLIYPLTATILRGVLVSRCGFNLYSLLTNDVEPTLFFFLFL